VGGLVKMLPVCNIQFADPISHIPQPISHIPGVFDSQTERLREPAEEPNLTQPKTNPMHCIAFEASRVGAARWIKLLCWALAEVLLMQAAVLVTLRYRVYGISLKVCLTITGTLHSKGERDLKV